MRDFNTSESFARDRDAADPLAHFRKRFTIPRQNNGREVAYFCGNSLGLQPKLAAEFVQDELRDWARMAVDGHFEGVAPWYSYHEFLRETGAGIVGALPHEVVFMNSLTVNLHLMMVSFYRPTKSRHKILIEAPAFPSDTYAVKTQIKFHGFEPDESLVIVEPRLGEHTVRTEDIEAALQTEGESIALVMIGGVNFLTGQFFDLARITNLAHEKGCMVGFDLAHAAGNVPLFLHKWGVDFACWCTYKYLNSGPGAVSGVFVHDRHVKNAGLPRFGGWWGNDPTTRFRMHLEPDFVPVPSADAWQLSNPPILAMAPIRASLAIFDEVGMPALRQKSEALTAYFAALIRELAGDHVDIITPDDPAHRGCQLSLLINDRPRERRQALQSAGVVSDFREPNIIRAAPVPLYNTHHDCWRFANALVSLR